MLVNKDSHQRETITWWLICLPLKLYGPFSSPNTKHLLSSVSYWEHTPSTENTYNSKSTQHTKNSNESFSPISNLWPNLISIIAFQHFALLFVYMSLKCISPHFTVLLSSFRLSFSCFTHFSLLYISFLSLSTSHPCLTSSQQHRHDSSSLSRGDLHLKTNISILINNSRAYWNFNAIFEFLQQFASGCLYYFLKCW